MQTKAHDAKNSPDTLFVDDALFYFGALREHFSLPLFSIICRRVPYTYIIQKYYTNDCMDQEMSVHQIKAHTYIMELLQLRDRRLYVSVNLRNVPYHS